jgi:hypothetical protein
MGYLLQNASHFILVERLAKKTLSLKSFRVCRIEEGDDSLEITIVANRRSLPVYSCCGRKHHIRDTLPVSFSRITLKTSRNPNSPCTNSYEELILLVKYILGFSKILIYQ